MSVSAKRSRVRRGRVLIVGNEPAVEQLCQCLQRQPVVVANVFQAMGEIATAPAGEPIVAAMIFQHVLPANARAASALRKLDPAVRLTLVKQESERSGFHRVQIQGSGQQLDIESDVEEFDDVLQAPVRWEDLHRIFDEDMLVPEPFTMSAAPNHEETPVSVQPVEQIAAPVPPLVIDLSSIEEAEDEAAVELELVANPLMSSPSPAPSTESPDMTTQGLGDTDLVEALMNNHAGVQATALQLLRQQTRWTDLDFSSESAQKERHWASQRVSHAGHDFGWLQTGQASAEELQPWADWLARWLVLDRAYREYRRLSFQDDLTSAWNRRFFDVFLREALAQAARHRRPVTLLVFDIDDFKIYNDRFGHAAGDDILRESVKLMQSVIRQGDRVCRIGGDEFAVVFADPEPPRAPGSSHPQTVEAIARRFQDQICTMRFPKLGKEAPGTLTVSAGLAAFPWDGNTPEALLRKADELALESKRAGKNVITLGPGAKRVESH